MVSRATLKKGSREHSAARERLGLSQAKLAKALGMSEPMMNR